jgi:hypothetical protein
VLPSLGQPTWPFHFSLLCSPLCAALSVFINSLYSSLCATLAALRSALLSDEFLFVMPLCSPRCATSLCGPLFCSSHHPDPSLCRRPLRPSFSVLLLPPRAPLCALPSVLLSCDPLPVPSILCAPSDLVLLTTTTNSLLGTQENTPLVPAGRSRQGEWCSDSNMPMC